MTCAHGVAVLALIVVPLGPAAADECAAAKTQLALDRCAGAAFEKADAELNRVYQDVTTRLKGQAETRTLLVAADKAWLGFRDGECDFEASSTIGGSVHPMIVTQCRTRLTLARSAALRGLLDCQEGDLSCPLPPR